MAGAILLSGALLADDVTVIGTVDDFAIPFILVGAYILDRIYSSGNANYLAGARL